MQIGAIGYNYSHNKDFVMDRPNGPGAWLFLLIKTSALFTLNGRKIKVKKNSFIILSPDMPCKYHAAEDVYTDDWAYFSADDTDREKFLRLKIPINEIVHLGSISMPAAPLFSLTALIAAAMFSSANIHSISSTCCSSFCS